MRAGACSATQAGTDSWPPMPVTPTKRGCVSATMPLPRGVQNTAAPLRSSRASTSLGARTRAEADPDREGLVDERAQAGLHRVGRRRGQLDRRAVAPVAPVSIAGGAASGARPCAMRADCTAVGTATCATKPRWRAMPRASSRATSGQSRSSSSRCAKWNSGPLSYSPRGSVSGPLSWIAKRPRIAAEVQADTTISVAPSSRAASSPVSALVRPGPVVVNTSTGRPLASDASVAANAAPLSWRQWRTRRRLADIACQSIAIAPPDTPNACSTPSASRSSTSADASETAAGAGGSQRRSTEAARPRVAVRCVVAQPACAVLAPSCRCRPVRPASGPPSPARARPRSRRC